MSSDEPMGFMLFKASGCRVPALVCPLLIGPAAPVKAISAAAVVPVVLLSDVVLMMGCILNDGTLVIGGMLPIACAPPMSCEPPGALASFFFGTKYETLDFMATICKFQECKTMFFFCMLAPEPPTQGMYMRFAQPE